MAVAPSGIASADLQLPIVGQYHHRPAQFDFTLQNEGGYQGSRATLRLVQQERPAPACAAVHTHADNRKLTAAANIDYHQDKFLTWWKTHMASSCMSQLRCGRQQEQHQLLDVGEQVVERAVKDCFRILSVNMLVRFTGWGGISAVLCSILASLQLTWN